MNVGISINFKSGSVDGRYYLQLFNEYVSFWPDNIMYKTHGKGWRENHKWNERKHLKIIEECDIYGRLNISEKGNVFIAGQTGSDAPHTSIGIAVDESMLDPNTVDIYEFINKHGFVSAYLYNDDYETVQSTKYSSNIKGMGLSAEILATLKNTPYSIEYETGIRVYDITHNPGRKELIGYTWIMPAWKMWFGKGFYHIVPKERILAFPDAIEIKELENEIVYVQLFEKIEESHTKESMDKQWAWREWLNFDELVKRYP